MSTPITLLQHASGGLWFKRFRIENITFNEAQKIGHVYGVDLTKKSRPEDTASFFAKLHENTRTTVDLSDTFDQRTELIRHEADIAVSGTG